MTSDALLEAKDLRVAFAKRRGMLAALRGVSFKVAAGGRLGIVGESGAGKSLAAAALLDLIPPPGQITGGEVWLEGRNLLACSSEQMRAVRGRRIAMVFQDPLATLNPVMTIGRQLVECLEAHQIAEGKKAEQIAVDRLTEVSIPSPQERMKAYPHELSGGMRQRVVIAAALICNPAIIVADEPTTALDVTIQADIMALLASLCRSRQMALILISHDLSLVSQMTDDILVLYAGLAVERGKTAQVISAPRHPYTRGLLASLTEREPGGRFYQIPGGMPPLHAIPSGCAFHPRCPHGQKICRVQVPAEQSGCACHFADSFDADSQHVNKTNLDKVADV